ncbi:MAG: response regulator [Desulfofustis sp.]|nr:response regulator [Desulfofustis sp.]
MKGQKSNKDRVAAWIWTVFASGLSADADLDVLRKHFLLNLIGILGAIFLCLFATMAVIQKEYVLGIMDGAILVYIGINLYVLRTRKNLIFVSLFGVLGTGIYFVFLVAYSGMGGSTYLWVFTYPLITLNLLGKKVGTYVSFSLLLLSLFCFLIPPGHAAQVSFDFRFISRFTAVYITIHLFSLVAEVVRERVQQRLRTSSTELLESLKRVQTSSDDLADINRQLLLEIEGRKRVQKALKDSQSFLNDVIESIQDGISVLNPDLTIRHTNSVMRQWYAQNMPLLGKKCHLCYHNKLVPCDPGPTIRCLASGRPEREIVPGLAGSSVDWLELFSFPIRDKETGKITGAVEFVRDITVAKRLEGQLYHAQKMQAVGTLAGGIAHDFNNLLMGIQGRTSLMAVDMSPNDPHNEHLRAIEEYIRSATNLTGQLLGAARGGKYNPRPTDLNDLVKKSSTMFGRARKEIRIKTLLSGIPVVADIDREQIEQVLLNMYVNSWQAMPKGGELWIGTSIEKLDYLFCEPHQIVPGNYTKISITDSGIGMDDATLQQVFDPFFTTKAKSRGTGLGLASAYGIVKNHSGFITAFSEVGNGSTFTIYLPVSNGLPDEKIAVEADIAKGSETILLVDDEKMIIDVGRALLTELGYRVLIAESGKQALEIIASGKETVDLVILDLIMPGMDGGTTFEALREVRPLLPVILSSGYAVDGLASEILHKGCNGFLQKPFTLSELSQKIRNVFQARDSAEEQVAAE